MREVPRAGDCGRGTPGAEGQDRRPAASDLRALLGAVPGNQARASVLFDAVQDGRLAGAAAHRCLVAPAARLAVSRRQHTIDSGRAPSGAFSVPGGRVRLRSCWGRLIVRSGLGRSRAVGSACEACTGPPPSKRGLPDRGGAQHPRVAARDRRAEVERRSPAGCPSPLRRREAPEPRPREPSKTRPRDRWEHRCARLPTLGAAAAAQGR